MEQAGPVPESHLQTGLMFRQECKIMIDTRVVVFDHVRGIHDTLGIIGKLKKGTGILLVIFTVAD